MEKAERTIQALLDMIYNGDLQLPEIKRGYKWRPQRSAELIRDLYRGLPAGQLTFWVHGEPVPTRLFHLDYSPANPINHLSHPIYLVDGEQRLTALARAFRDHPDTQIVFNIFTEEFEAKSAKRSGIPWVPIYDITGDSANPYTLVDKLFCESIQLDRSELAERLFRISGILRQTFNITILKNTSYPDVLDICTASKGGGEQWTISERARATFAISWPRVTEVLQAEAQHWKSRDYGVIDHDFLTQALLMATRGELSRFAVEAAKETNRETLEAHWRIIYGGLRHLVPLLKNNLRITHCNYLKHPLTLLPLIIYLGERPSGPLDREKANSLLYWLLVATIRKRNRNESDGTLSQDITWGPSGSGSRYRIRILKDLTTEARTSC